MTQGMEYFFIFSVRKAFNLLNILSALKISFNIFKHQIIECLSPNMLFKHGNGLN